MAATKGTSRVGQGMKPRGEQAAKPAEEKPASPDEMPVSTNQVQPEGAEGAENKPSSDTETPPSQETKTADFPPAVPESAFKLAEMLKQSAERLSGTVPDTENTAKVKPDLEPAAVIHAIEEDEHKRHAGVDRVDVYRKVGDEYVKLDEGGLDLGQMHPLMQVDVATGKVSPVGTGPQANGDFGVVIAIPEYFVQSVKDFAESDGGKSVEQWCSEFFNMHLEAYCTPLKGR